MKSTLVIFACALPTFGASEWIRIASPNFEILSNAGAKEAAKTLAYFEQVRDFFSRSRNTDMTTRLPVTIVGFRNVKEYKPYTSHEWTSAYYAGDENRDFIVMGGIGEENFPLATHEYMHLLVRHSGLKVPVWLNEGMAEVYSSLKPMGNSITIGDVLPGRVQRLLRDKWLPLQMLVNIGHDSQAYNERDRAGILYAQSWLLCHMVMLSDQYRASSGKFLQVVNETQSSEEAFRRVYGKSLAMVEKDLTAYFRSNSVNRGVFPMKLEKISVGDPQPVEDLQIGVLLAKLSAMLERYDVAESRLKELESKFTDSVDVQEALGHLYWQKRDDAKAKLHLGKAVELNSPSWKTYWDYARLAQDAPPGDPLVIKALEQAIAKKPDLMDARLMLGHRYFGAKQYGQSLATLRQVKNVSPERASRVFLLIAHASLQLNDKAEARKAALQAKKHASSPIDIQEADSVLEYLDRAERSLAANTAVPYSETEPRIQRRPGPQTTWDVPPSEPEEKLSTISGKLTAIECLGKTAKVRVVVGGTSLAFLIRDPAKVYVKDAGQEQQVLTCGPGRSTVAIQYLPKDDPEARTVGDVRVIEYLGAGDVK